MRIQVRALVVAMAVTGIGPAHGSAQNVPDEGVRQLLVRLEGVVQRSDGAAYEALLADGADHARAAGFVSAELVPGMTRAVIQERDRLALAGTLPGEGYSLIVDVFEEYGGRARISTWWLDIKRTGVPRTGTQWMVLDQGRLSSVEDLYKLALNPTKKFTARNLEFSDEDLDLTLVEGSVFVSEIDQGTTAVVLTGRGDMKFHPTPDTEKSQVRIFGGAEALETSFDAAYIRINPDDFDRLISSPQLAAAPVDQNDFRRADRIFREDSLKSYNLELGDLSRDTWSLVPPPRDFVAEIHTRRFDTLSYSHTSSLREDISLFDRNRHKTIAVYSSRLNDQGGAPAPGDDNVDFDVTHYDIEVSATPDRRWIEGRAELTAQVGANRISSLTLRLADPLVVQSVVSKEYGRLFNMRVKDQNSVVVSLPADLRRGSVLTLTINYAGRIEPETLDAETIALPQQGPPSQDDNLSVLEPEPSYVYSNQSNWYPRPATSRYATATLRITVPANLDCVASGEPDAHSPVLVPAKDSLPARKMYVFNAVQPLRYLAFVVGRFAAPQSVAIAFPPSTLAANERPGETLYRALKVSVEANRSNTGRGREVRDHAVDIARFYQSLLDDSPYPSFTVALTESKLPGGHSPGYFAVLNEPPPASSFEPRNDPASFDRYPDFFLAHELAHQWWGQAVGWRSYHEQWLSEGFAQYFAALYAQRQRGDDAYRGMMRTMRKWAIDQTDEGPISLGYRLGHIRGDGRIFRALVYDKSAIVLHMLRGLVGDETFFRGLRRFYRTSRFRSAGTNDFRVAMEAEAGRPLARFFDRWIYGSALPRLKFSYRIEGSEAVLHIEQVGDVFDLPVVITLQYTDKPSADVVIPVTDRMVDMRVPLAGVLRSADISKDEVPLAEIVKN